MRKRHVLQHQPADVPRSCRGHQAGDQAAEGVSDQVDHAGVEAVEETDDVLAEQLQPVRTGPVTGTVAAQIDGTDRTLGRQIRRDHVPVTGGRSGGGQQQDGRVCRVGGGPYPQRKADVAEHDVDQVGHHRSIVDITARGQAIPLRADPPLRVDACGAVAFTVRSIRSSRSRGEVGLCAQDPRTWVSGRRRAPARLSHLQRSGTTPLMRLATSGRARRR